MNRDAAKAAFDAARAEVLRVAEEEADVTRRLNVAREALSDARAALARADAHVWIDRCREAHPTPTGAVERVGTEPRTDRPSRDVMQCEGRTTRAGLRMRRTVYEPEAGPLVTPTDCTWVGVRVSIDHRWTVRAGTAAWRTLKTALDAVEVER